MAISIDIINISTNFFWANKLTTVIRVQYGQVAHCARSAWPIVSRWPG